MYGGRDGSAWIGAGGRQLSVQTLKALEVYTAVGSYISVMVWVFFCKEKKEKELVEDQS